MKTIISAAATVVMLASCSKTEKAAVIGAASGAVIAGVVTGDVRGAAIGAAAGGATGALVGRASEPGRCLYRDRFGRRYQARCR